MPATKKPAPIPMHRVTARGVKRRLITSIEVSRDLTDIDVPAGATGTIVDRVRGDKYEIAFDDKTIGNALLTPDEFTCIKQRLDMSR